MIGSGDHSPADALCGGVVSDPNDEAVHSCLVLLALGGVKAPCFLGETLPPLDEAQGQVL